jgi:hypothetical protein
MYAGRIIHELLDAPQGSVNFLPALSNALAGNSAQILELARVLNQGVSPLALANEVYAVTTLLGFYRHQRSDPGWTLGTYQSRLNLRTTLWQQAAEQKDPQAGLAYARAAFLLATQEAFQFGLTSCFRLASLPEFIAISKWPKERIDNVRRFLRNDAGVSKLFGNFLIDLANPLQRLIDSSSEQLNRTDLGEVVGIIDRLALLAGSRPDIQWRIANTLWRLLNLSSGDASAMAILNTKSDEWNTLVNDSNLSRWLAEAREAVSVRPRTIGYRLMSSAEAKSKLQRL